MSKAQQDVGVPIGDRIAKMKQFVARLEALQKHYPDLLIKTGPIKDIYMSKIIWSEVDDLEILEGSNVLKVLPFKDIDVIFHDNENTFKSSYRVYTNLLEICLIGYYLDNWSPATTKNTFTVIQIQDYKKAIEPYNYKHSLLEKIDEQVYLYLKRTILKEPSKYKIENEEHLSNKLQTLITFS